jgi:hypothetical protein
MRAFSVLLVLLTAGITQAQITVPASVEAHKPVVATLKATLPDGAQLRGTWSVSGGEYLQVDPLTIHIWAATGVHTVAASGVWVVTKRVTLPDGQALDALVDFGQYQYTADFTVGKAVPPGPPPIPPGNKRAVILEETSQRTPQQAALWLQARKALGAKLLILDKDLPSAAAYSAAAGAADLPALVVLVGDQVVTVSPCPATLEALQKAVQP